MNKIAILGISIVILLAGALQVALSSADGQADEWPTFMHDWRRTSITSASLPDELTLLWKYEIQGASIPSSPAVARGKVYFSARENYGKGENERLWVYALDVESGGLVWKRETDGGALFLSPSPTVVNGRVYVGSWDNYIYALNAENGGLIWRFYMEPPYPTINGVDGAPIVVDGRVYVGSWNGYMYCLNADDGSLIWRAKVPGHIIGSPSLANDLIYFGTGAGGENTTGEVYALNTNDGSEIWKFHVGDEISASPVIVDNVVHIGGGWMGFLSGDGIYALNAENGQLIWYYDSQNKPVSSTLVMADKVFFTSRGSLYALNANNGALVWSVELGGGTHGSPTGVDGKVVVGGGDGLYVIDASTGAILQHLKTYHFVWSTPAIAYGKVYFGSLDGTFYAYGSKGQAGTNITELLKWPLVIVCIVGVLGAIVALARRRSAPREFEAPASAPGEPLAIGVLNSKQYLC